MKGLNLKTLIETVRNRSLKSPNNLVVVKIHPVLVNTNTKIVIKIRGKKELGIIQQIAKVLLILHL